MPELGGDEGGGAGFKGFSQGWDLRKLFEQQREQQKDGPYWRLHPLLDRFALTAQLQLAMAVHPRYPKVGAWVVKWCRRYSLPVSQLGDVAAHCSL
jgi:hypothetical protein